MNFYVVTDLFATCSLGEDLIALRCMEVEQDLAMAVVRIIEVLIKISNRSF